MHMFAFNFQMGRQASNNSVSCCFMDLAVWLTYLPFAAGQETVPHAQDADTLMAGPGFWTLKPDWCKKWFACTRLWKGSPALYICGALESRIIQTALLSGTTALHKCVSWSLGQILFKEADLTISIDILVMAKIFPCVEGLVMIPLFLSKCSSADFLKGFLYLCVSGLSSWLGEFVLLRDLSKL